MESMAAGGVISTNDQFDVGFYSMYLVFDKMHVVISTTVTSTHKVNKDRELNCRRNQQFDISVPSLLTLSGWQA